MNKIFSGIRPSGKLHLGNYLGALKNWIALQDDPQTEQVIYGLMDYHAITTSYDPKTFHQQILEMAAEFLAAGVDPEKSLLIRQSHVPQHTELAWLFNTITPTSWLERLPTYKEKIEQSNSNTLGLLAYPVLMAADILVYKANMVPVGDDQKAHIDVANEIVKKFNSMFSQVFEPIKAPVFEGARIMSLQDPTKKMSKTGDEGIALTDSPDAIRTKIKKAVTDSGSDIVYNPDKKGAISNLLTIYRLLSDKSYKELEKEYAGKTYSDFKEGLTEVVISFLKPFKEKYHAYVRDLGQLESILTESEASAKSIAEQTLAEVKKAMGI